MSIVGFVPSSFRPFRCPTNIGTRVPSFDVNHTCSSAYASLFTGTGERHHSDFVPRFAS